MDIANYTTYDLPVPYKNLKLYPVLVKDYKDFNIGVLSLTFDKNSIPIPEIIRMTNLEYIYYTSIDYNENSDVVPYLYCLNILLRLVLKDIEDEEDAIIYNYDEKGKPFFKIGDEIFKSEDFEKIKEIIVEQNMVDLPDKTISKEVRDSLEKAREYKRKLAGEKPISTEDYIVSLSIVTGFDVGYIYDMTLRKFYKSLERVNNLIHYQIYLTASMSGMVEFKDKSFIKHWLANLEEDKYKDVSVDLDALQGKVSFEEAKKK